MDVSRWDAGKGYQTEIPGGISLFAFGRLRVISRTTRRVLDNENADFAAVLTQLNRNVNCCEILS